VTADADLAELRRCLSGPSWLHVNEGRNSASDKLRIALHSGINAGYRSSRNLIRICRSRYGMSVIEIIPADRFSYSMSLHLQPPLGR